MRQKHCCNYFAFTQSYLAEGKIAPVVLLPHEAKQKCMIYMGGSGMDRTDDFQKFCGSGLDRIQFYRIRTGLGLKNFTVGSSLLQRYCNMFFYYCVAIMIYAKQTLSFALILCITYQGDGRLHSVAYIVFAHMILNFGSLHL